jgi:hypothetical protein
VTTCAWVTTLFCQVQAKKELAKEADKTAVKQGQLTSQGNKLVSLKKRLEEAQQTNIAKEKECERLQHKIQQLQEKLVSGPSHTLLRCCPTILPCRPTFLPFGTPSFPFAPLLPPSSYSRSGRPPTVETSLPCADVIPCPALSCFACSAFSGSRLRCATRL